MSTNQRIIAKLVIYVYIIGILSAIWLNLYEPDKYHKKEKSTIKMAEFPYTDYETDDKAIYMNDNEYINYRTIVIEGSEYLAFKTHNGWWYICPKKNNK